MIHLIGDCHGKIQRYLQIINALPPKDKSIQLGDMGIGFSFLPKQLLRHKFIRGNHDDPAKSRKHPNYAGDYGFLQKPSIFFVGGAYSIDWKCRIPGVSWWSDEQLSILQLDAAYDLYVKVKPRIVISHECPSEVARNMLRHLSGEYFAEKMECANSRTAQALQRMFEAHHPEHWIFGHYHIDRIFELHRVRFQCLDELSTTTLSAKEKQ